MVLFACCLVSANVYLAAHTRPASARLFAAIYMALALLALMLGR